MQIQKIYCSLLSIALLFAVTIAHAQIKALSEEEVIKNAATFFSSRQYAKAFPLYSQIVSNHPENPEYNYRMGVCIMKAGNVKGEAIRFLQKATLSYLNPVDSWLYFGKALHENEDYSEAIKAFENYKLNASKSEWNTAKGEELIKCCTNGQNCKFNIAAQTHKIIQSQQTTSDDFFRAYENLAGNGRFLKLPKDYEDKNTKGEYESSFLFLAANGNIMVYSNKGKAKERSYEIFKVIKDAKGLWMFPEQLDGIINTADDNAYPVIVNDGKTIYFSSNGSQGIGGYDIYRTDFNETTKKWSEPVSLGPPVNSPADDFFYLPSEDNKTAWFSSTRQSAPGNCKVFKTTKIELSESYITVNGTVNLQQDIDLTTVRITILDEVKSSTLVSFAVPSRNGSFTLKMPVAQQATYIVTPEGSSDLSAQVNFNEVTGNIINQTILISRDKNNVDQLSISFTNPLEVNAVTDTKNPNTSNATVPFISIVNTENENISTTEESKNPAKAESALKPAEKVVVKNTKILTANDASSSISTDKKISGQPVEDPIVNVVNAPQATKENTDTEKLVAVNNLAQPPAVNDLVPAESKVVESKKEKKLRLKKASNTEDISAAVADKINPVIASPVVPAEAGKNFENVVFRVQLGAFKTKTVEQLKKKYDLLGLNNLVYVKNDQDLLVVMTGTEKNYQAAVKLKEQLRTSGGIPDAFIVVYSEGTRMPIALFETDEE
jgi:tetratricopeptide (TPR) repeat protein